MAEHRIECSICGGEYIARRSDAKKCASCRLLGILTYTASRAGPRTCRACGDTYRPFRTGDRLCGVCDTRDRSTVITCLICKEDRPMFQRVAVCPPCAKGKDSQPVVIRALQKGQAARKASNDA
jgi:hypothetical protein